MNILLLLKLPPTRFGHSLVISALINYYYGGCQMAIFLAPSFLPFLLVENFLLWEELPSLWAAAQSCGLGELGWGTEGAGQALRSSLGFL